MYRYVRLRTGDAWLAEDLTAQVFEEAIKGICSYRYRGKPVLAWLYRIARNLVSDYFKRAKRTQAQPLSATREEGLVAVIAPESLEVKTDAGRFAW